MREGGQRNQHIEVQIAQFGRLEALVCPDGGKNLTRFKPVLLRWSEDGVVSFERVKYLVVNWRSGATPKFGKDNRGVSSSPYSSAIRRL